MLACLWTQKRGTDTKNEVTWPARLILPTLNEGWKCLFISYANYGTALG